MSKVKVLNPDDAERVGKSHFALKSGEVEFRRVISSWEQGATHLDGGYNIYSAGTQFEGVCYDREEVCYVASGSRKGAILLRYKGAVSDVSFDEPADTVCFFSPPRPKDWVATGVPLGQQTGAPKRILQKEIPEEPVKAGIVEGAAWVKSVITKQRDNSEKMSASLARFEAGTTWNNAPSDVEEIAFVIEGSGKITDGEAVYEFRQNSFIHQPPGEAYTLAAQTEVRLFVVKSPNA